MAISETKRSGVESYHYPVKESQRYINLNPFVQQPPKRERDQEDHLNYYASAYNSRRQLFLTSEVRQKIGHKMVHVYCFHFTHSANLIIWSHSCRDQNQRGDATAEHTASLLLKPQEEEEEQEEWNLGVVMGESEDVGEELQIKEQLKSS